MWVILDELSKNRVVKALLPESAVSFSYLFEFFCLKLRFLLALDPAKPWFDLTNASNKVSKEDATLVDVIHTNSGFLLYVRYIFYQFYLYSENVLW